MAFCRRCGSEIDEDAKNCEYCGAKVGEEFSENNVADSVDKSIKINFDEKTQKNEGSNTYGILGIVFSIIWPLLGLIFSILAMVKSPKGSSCFKMGLIGFIISISFVVLVLILHFFGFSFFFVRFN